MAQAHAEAQAAFLDWEAERAEARAELERAVSVLRERQRALENFEGGVVSQLPKLRTMAETAYPNGRGTILELLDAFRSLKDLQLRHIAQHEAVKLAEAEVIVAAGLGDQVE